MHDGKRDVLGTNREDSPGRAGDRSRFNGSKGSVAKDAKAPALPRI